jgi:4-carboxymuconolactone decarboxylase
MTELYGADYATQVANRLEELDPELNKVIQSVAYDQLWSRDGLSLRDKSLVTVAALIAMGKEEQTRIHMTGFLNSGGQVDDLRAALIHLATYCGFPATMNGFAALRGVLDSGNIKSADLKAQKGKPKAKKK